MPLLVRAVRAPFFTATIVPVVLGAVMGWYEGGQFHWGWFFLTLVGAVAAHAGANTLNDYFDHRYGNDEAHPAPTPFSGGSRVIQDGLLSARQVLLVSVVSFGIMTVCGLILSVARGWPILVMGVIGLAVAVSYNARLAYWGRGLGEFLVGLGFGPLMVLGAYYVQAQTISTTAVWASVPVAFLIAEVLYINEFPDVVADTAVSKRTMVAWLGPEAAMPGYAVLLVGTYLVILLGAVVRVLPWAALIALLTLPLALRGIRGVQEHFEDIPRLLPTNALTIQVHLVTGLLLSLAFVLDGLLLA
jgi:1,4-dihydroxy-2-naphthoate octaprenyltransferase